MSPVLQALTLGAYRGIAGLALNGLLPVSLVVGANNAGKTSILEAAGLVLRPMDPAQWADVVQQRDADAPWDGVDGLWSVFPGSAALPFEDALQTSETMRIHGQIAGDPRRVEARCVASGAAGTGERVARVEVSVDERPAVALKFPSPAPIHPDVVMQRVFSMTPSTHRSTRALVEHLSGAVNEGKKHIAVSLARLFDPAIEDLDVVAAPDRQCVRVSHHTRGVVDLSSFGDGMSRATALALALARASRGVLLIDEIEAGIHPSILRSVFLHLLDAAVVTQTQIIATTHSLEAVDTLLTCTEDRGLDTSFCAFWIKQAAGKHEARRYDHARLRALREEGLDVR